MTNSTTSKVTKTPSIDKATLLNTATIPELNLSFQYPSDWGDIVVAKDLKNTKTGTTFAIGFNHLNGKYINMGFASPDFETIIGRSATNYEFASKYFDEYKDCKSNSSDTKQCIEIKDESNKLIGYVVKKENSDSMFGETWIEAYYLTGNKQYPIIGILEQQVDKPITTPLSIYESIIKSFTIVNKGG